MNKQPQSSTEIKLVSIKSINRLDNFNNSKKSSIDSNSEDKREFLMNLERKKQKIQEDFKNIQNNQNKDGEETLHINKIRRISLAIPKTNRLNSSDNLNKQEKQGTFINRMASKKQTAKNLPELVRKKELTEKINQEFIKLHTKTSLKGQNTIKIENEINEKKEKEALKLKKQCYSAILSFIDSIPIIIILSVATIFALFGDNILTLGLTVDFDLGFDIVKTICMTLFFIEIILSSIVKNGYLWSFFFWLDIISTISLIQDIRFMINPMIYGTYFI
jgi:hypothetical protein